MRSDNRVVTGVLLLVIVSTRAGAASTANECLIGFDGLGDAVKNGGTLHCKDCDARCDADPGSTPNGSCTFTLKACVNDAGSGCAGTELKKVSVRGNCGASTLGFTPGGTALACGPEGSLTVSLKKHGRNSGKCKVKAKTISNGR